MTMKPLLLTFIFLLGVGCVSNLTEEERAYAVADRYQVRLDKFYVMQANCKQGVWIVRPSSKYLRTGVPTKWDLKSVTCGQPSLLW